MNEKDTTYILQAIKKPTMTAERQKLKKLDLPIIDIAQSPEQNQKAVEQLDLEDLDG